MQRRLKSDLKAICRRRPFFSRILAFVKLVSHPAFGRFKWGVLSSSHTRQKIGCLLGSPRQQGTSTKGMEMDDYDPESMCL